MKKTKKVRSDFFESAKKHLSPETLQRAQRYATSLTEDIKKMHQQERLIVELKEDIKYYKFWLKYAIEIIKDGDHIEKIVEELENVLVTSD